MDKIENARKTEIATQINEAHHACCAAEKSAVEHARRAGRLLQEAKKLVEHGSWAQWLQENFEGSARTAQVYMQLATEMEANPQSSADSIASILRGKRAATKPKVDEPLAPLTRAVHQIPADAKVRDVMERVVSLVQQRFGVAIEWNLASEEA